MIDNELRIENTNSLFDKSDSFNQSNNSGNPAELITSHESKFFIFEVVFNAHPVEISE
jgi:hypothetical protein